MPPKRNGIAVPGVCRDFARAAAGASRYPIFPQIPGESVAIDAFCAMEYLQAAMRDQSSTFSSFGTCATLVSRSFASWKPSLKPSGSGVSRLSLFSAAIAAKAPANIVKSTIVGVGAFHNMIAGARFFSPRGDTRRSADSWRSPLSKSLCEMWRAPHCCRGGAGKARRRAGRRQIVDPPGRRWKNVLARPAPVVCSSHMRREPIRRTAARHRGEQDVSALQALDIARPLSRMGAMNPTRVETRIDGPVFTIAMNRPDKRNAVDGPMAGELLRAFERFESG